jgi:hypothetical protein
VSGRHNGNGNNAFDAPLTLDPHAAFAHHFHNANGNSGNGNGKHDAGTPTPGGLPSPRLSPNAYFLPELEAMEVCTFHFVLSKIVYAD